MVDFTTMHFLNMTSNETLPISIDIGIHSPIRVVLKTVQSLEAIASIIGNLLTIVSIAHFKSLQTGTNYILASLACTDLLTAVCFFISFPLDFIIDGMVWQTVCIFDQVINLIMTSSNIVHVTVIAMDRFIAVSAPLRYSSWVTTHRAKIFLCALWCILITLYAPILMLGHNLVGTRRSICSFFTILRADILKTVAAITVGLCSTITVSLYIRIYFLIRKQHRRMAFTNREGDGNVSTISAHHRKAEARTTTTMLIVLTVYVGCTMPGLLLSMTMKNFSPAQQDYMLDIIIAIWYISIFINPFIYAWRNVKFRKAFTSLLRCGQAGQVGIEQSTNTTHST